MDNHAIVVADASGVIQLWSRGAERLFGYTAAAAVGQKLDLIVPEDFRERHWAGFRHAMESGAAQYEGQPFDLPVRAHDGAVTAFPGLFRLLRDASNHVIGAMAIFSAPASGAAAAENGTGSTS
jgi:PAS domain S-box-containing protein